MAAPRPVDPRLLAAEIEASVAEFNWLDALAGSLQIQVIAVVSEQAMPGATARPILALQVVAPL